MHITKSSSPALSAPWRKLLLSFHVAITVSVLGADLVLLTLGIASLGGADPRTIYPAAHVVSIWLTAPLAVLSLATGLLLGWLSPWGVFKYWWVMIKLTITLGLIGIVLFVVAPRLGMVADLVTAPGSDSLPTSSRVPLVIAPALASSLLLLNVGLAIFKPGRRLRARATPERGIVPENAQRSKKHEISDSMRRCNGEN
jgi:hypothetical protein